MATDQVKRMLTRSVRIYTAVAGALVIGWIVLGYVVLTATPYARTGPADLRHVTSDIPPDLLSVARAADSLLNNYPDKGALYASAPGGPVWVIYAVEPDGSVYEAAAFDADTKQQVGDASRLINSGAWEYLGFVKQPADWVFGGIALVAILLATGRWAMLSDARRLLASRTASRNAFLRLIGHPVVVALSFILVIGFISVWFAPGWNRAKQARWAFRAALAWALFFLVLAMGRGYPEGDLPSVAAPTYIALAGGAAWLLGFALLRPAGAARIAQAGQTQLGPQLAAPPISAAMPSAVVTPPSGGPERAARPAGATSGEAARAPREGPESRPFNVTSCEDLPDFSTVGGMSGLKAQLEATVGRLLAFPTEASDLAVAFGGLLLFGPPGTGKTFVVQALAGEYGLGLVTAHSGDLVSAFRGESSQRIVQAFAAARSSAPCVLFFDEFDSIGRRRDGGLSSEERTELTTLLRELESVRARKDVIVVAATNDLSSVDPAAIRPGRFDRHIRVDLPDREARGAIFRAQLATRRRVAAEIDYDLLSERSAGMTPAAISRVVRRAAEMVLDSIAVGDHDRELTTDDLLTALKAGAGDDRPTVEGWSWDRLVLAEQTTRELRQMQVLIEHPERVAALGLPPLTGALLYGPPGTGKTTIARVLAREASCNFYPLKGSDLVSKWVGETERNIADAFRRARENAPAIVFIDEIDAIAPRRGHLGFEDRALNELLQEIDGLGTRPGVFVLGATNRRDVLDPALLRGGRLGRQIEIPLPTESERTRLLSTFTAAMPLAPDVDVAAIAATASGFSGADLQELCQEAGLQALVRQPDVERPTIAAADFAAARRTSSTRR